MASPSPVDEFFLGIWIMKLAICVIGGLLLLLTAGCEVEDGYGGAYGAYGEYPYTYYGGGYGYAPVYPSPYYGDGDWREHQEHEYWEHHRWHGGEDLEDPDWR